MYCEPETRRRYGRRFRPPLQGIGFAGIARAAVVEKDFSKIQETAAEYLADQLEEIETFKVEAKAP